MKTGSYLSEADRRLVSWWPPQNGQKRPSAVALALGLSGLKDFHMIPVSPRIKITRNATIGS
jgi:hypothetical protein